MKIYQLEENDLLELIETIVARMQIKQPVTLDKWIDASEAMRLLRISSVTTLQKFRDEGAIRFTQPSKKIILYDRQSILEFLDKNARNPF